MTTDEALRMIDVDRRDISQVEEKNKEVRSILKKGGIPFANLSADIPNPYMITEPLLKLYAEGRRTQAALCEQAYFEWIMQQNQMDINGNIEDGGKAQKEKMMEEIMRAMG